MTHGESFGVENQNNTSRLQEFTTALSTGDIYTVTELIHSGTLTPEELRAAEVRTVYTERLRATLHDGYIEEAKILIDLDILTLEEIRDMKDVREACVEAVKVWLRDGFIDEAKEIIDLDILTMEEIRLTRMVD